jgi:hypothetical protein
VAMRIKRYLKQEVVYWAKRAADRAGQSTYDPPVQLLCRWDDGVQTVIEPDGRMVSYTAQVMFGPEVDIKEGSLIFKGTLTQARALVQYPTVPSAKQGSREVLRVERTPGMRTKNLLMIRVWL